MSSTEEVSRNHSDVHPLTVVYGSETGTAQVSETLIWYLYEHKVITNEHLNVFAWILEKFKSRFLQKQQYVHAEPTGRE